MKIRQVGAELFHADGRTDMTNISRYSQFRERAQKKDNRYVNRQSKPERYEVQTASSFALLIKKT